jgi:hypothetical protein
MADKKKTETPGAVAGNDANVQAFSDAARELKRRKGPLDPPPTIARNGIRAQTWPGTPPNWTPNDLGLPKEVPCPVEPIGFEGDLFHLIDSMKQFRSVTAGDLSHAGIQSLFAATPNYPAFAWPRHGKSKNDEDGKPQPPPITSFKDDDVRQAVMLACTRQGLFSPQDKLRGRGAWLMRGGHIAYHAGEDVWICERDPAGRPKFIPLETGQHQGHLYPRLSPLPAPWIQPIGATEMRETVGALLETFRKWNFERPEVDPVLLLGWVGVAYLGGALDWRSAVLLLGGFGTGKSELQKGLQALFGDHLMPSSDTTAPAIAQTLKQDTRAVAVDELEAEADPRKADAVLALMRAASSGDFRRRGSSDQRAVETHLRSAFLFSAINNPIGRSQDVSRVAVLRLRELNRDQTKPPAVNAEIWGRIVLARLMSEWPRFEATREEYMKALAAGGHVARGQKTYGTLLACADLLLGDELGAELNVPLSAEAETWTELLGVETLPESEDAMPNYRAVYMHLLTAQVPNWRQGRRMTIGQIIADLKKGLQDFGPDEAKRELADAGLGLVVPGAVCDASDGWVLAVPNQHNLVMELFRGSVWQGSAGGGGPWKDALRQAPPGFVVTDRAMNRVWIGGVQPRCTLVVLKRFEEDTR